MGCREKDRCCCCGPAKVESGAGDPLHDGGPELAEGDVGGGVFLGDAAAGNTDEGRVGQFTREHNFAI